MSENKNENLAFTCSNCGAPMKANDFVCKSCYTDINGNKVDKEQYLKDSEKDSLLEELIPSRLEDYSDVEYSCSNCGAILKEEDVICSNCGADVSEVEDEEDMVSEDEDEIIYHCGNCDEVLNDDDTVCPKCGAEVLDEEETFTCPHCGETVNEDDDVCAACGGELLREIPDDYSRTVVLQTFNNVFEAGIIKELLGAHEIESFISTDDEGGMAPFLTQQRGARLLVMEKDLKKAIEIVNTPGEENTEAQVDEELEK